MEFQALTSRWQFKRNQPQNSQLVDSHRTPFFRKIYCSVRKKKHGRCSTDVTSVKTWAHLYYKNLHTCNWQIDKFNEVWWTSWSAAGTQYHGGCSMSIWSTMHHQVEES